MYSFPACAGMLVGLILYRSYTGNQNHVEFMSAAILLCPEDTVFCFFFTSDFFNVFALLFHIVSQGFREQM